MDACWRSRWPDRACSARAGRESAISTIAEPEVPILNDQAAVFGKREGAWGMTLSPDGKHVMFLGADHDANTALQVADADGGSPAHVIASSNGMPTSLSRCEWANNSRIVCSIVLSREEGGILVGYERLIAMDIDGKNVISLAQRDSVDAPRGSHVSGDVIDWRQGETGKVLIERDHIPDSSIGTHIQNNGNGLAVDLVDTHFNNPSTSSAPTRSPRATSPMDAAPFASR